MPAPSRARPVPSFSDFIAFVDESGDHSLAAIHSDYPVFVLAICIFSKEEYAAGAAPAVLRFKFRHFGHDQVVLHELDMRRSKGAFKFLLNAGLREPFYADLNALMAAAPMTLVASVIHKERHRARYAEPTNPYHIAMSFGLERVYRHLHGLGCRGGTTHLLFERRGAKEDAELEEAFRRVCEGRNAAGRPLPFEIVMAAKTCNSAGLQLADLVARPIGRKVIKPSQENRAYDILQRKFRRSPAGRVLGWGLKIFPS